MCRSLFACIPPVFACPRGLASAAQLRYNIFEKKFPVLRMKTGALFVKSMVQEVRKQVDRSGQITPERSEQFERLYGMYADDVLRMAYFYLADRQKAEDVCQDVFVKLLTRGDMIEPGKEKAWLLRVTVNCCRDLWRGAWLRRVVLGAPTLDVVPAQDETVEEREEKAELMRAVNRLPAPFRETILLHYYQGLGIAEIAQMLNLPEGTISSRLSRARKKLEVLLKEEATGE